MERSGSAPTPEYQFDNDIAVNSGNVAVQASGGAWTQIVSVTGRGIIDVLKFLSTSSGHDYRVTIDGGTARYWRETDTTSANRWLAGLPAETTTPGGNDMVSTGSVACCFRFKSSFLVEAISTGATPGTVKVVVAGQKA